MRRFLRSCLVLAWAAVVAGCQDGGDESGGGRGPAGGPATTKPAAQSTAPARTQSATAASGTSLVEAVMKGDAEQVRNLIAARTDVNVRDEGGKAALSWAGELDHVEIVKLFLEARADPNLQTTGTFAGLGPLHYAAGHGRNEIVRLLISSGAQVNLKGKWDATPLHIAAFNAHWGTVLLLLEKGADAKAVKEDGSSVLHELAQASSAGVPAAKALIAAKVDVNAVNKQGQTALHLAAMQGNKPIVELLLDSGADVNAKDKKDKTALELARKRRKQEVVALLQARGAKE